MKYLNCNHDRKYRNSKPKRCRKCYMSEEKTYKRLKEIGIRGAEKRWLNHIKIEKKYKGFWKGTHDKSIQLQKKRFRNQRYRAKKRINGGSHTFEEWLLLKAFYNYMCLCCKQFEPEIKLSEDHIVPLSLGGDDSISNIQPLCVSCNTRKHTKVINYKLSYLSRGGETISLTN